MARRPIGVASPLPVNSPVRWASFAEATAPTLFCLKRWTTRQPKSESGQAAVELALVVPVICLLVLALVDFGKGLNYWLNANQLANLGSRQAAVIGTDPQPNGNLAGWVQSQAETSELRNGTGSVTSPARVCINFVPNPDPNQSGSTGQVGDPVKVTVTAPYKWIPFVGGATLNITATSTMRLERQPDPSLDGECSS